MNKENKIEQLELFFDDFEDEEYIEPPTWIETEERYDILDAETIKDKEKKRPYIESLREVLKSDYGNRVTVKKLKTKDRLYEIKIKEIDLNFVVPELDIMDVVFLVFIALEVVNFKKNKKSDWLEEHLTNGEKYENMKILDANINKIKYGNGFYISAQFGKYDNNGKLTPRKEVIVLPLPFYNISYEYSLDNKLIKDISLDDIKNKHEEILGKIDYNSVDQYALNYLMLIDTLEKTKTTDADIEKLYSVINVAGSNYSNKKLNYHSTGSSEFQTTIMNLFRYSNIYNIFIHENTTIYSNVVSKNSKRIEKKPKNKKNRKRGFDAVYGLDTIKKELRSIGDIVKYNNDSEESDIDVPRGILLIGLPGTGKTMITHAFAEEYEFHISKLQDFHHTGMGSVDASLFTRAFDQVERISKSNPVILFIDEIDKIFSESNEESISSLLSLLSDNGDINNNVIIMAACNREENLPAMLTRPGRFDKKLYFGDLSFESKIKIFDDILKDREVNTENINTRTVVGFLPQDITVVYLDSIAKQLKVNETLENRTLDTSDAIEVAEVIVNGVSEVVQLNPLSKERIAWHEAGHAAISLLVKEAEITSATIRQTYNALGYVSYRYDEEKMTTQEDIEATILSSLAGWATEKLIYGDLSMGAASDFSYVENYINYLLSYSGSEGTHMISINPFLNINNSVDEKNEAFKYKKKNIRKYVRKTNRLLKNNMTLLTRIKNLLIEKEKVSGDELHKLYKNYVEEKGKRRKW